MYLYSIGTFNPGTQLGALPKIQGKNPKREGFSRNEGKTLQIQQKYCFGGREVPPPPPRWLCVCNHHLFEILKISNFGHCQDSIILG